MLITLELLKKESMMIVGNKAHTFEKAAMKLSTLMSAGQSDLDPDKYTDAFFMGLPSTLTVNEPFESFVRRVNELSHGRWDTAEVESQPRTFADFTVQKSLCADPDKINTKKEKVRVNN